MLYYNWCAANGGTPIIYAEVSEWFKEPVLKTGDSAMGRGFESHPLRSFYVNLF